MNLSRKTVVLIFVAVLGLAIAIVTGMMLLGPARNAFGFAAERTHYEAIVAEVDRQLLLDDTLLAFRATELADAKTLRLASAGERPERGEGRGWVWAMREKGVLQVWIETEDRGHAGESGYAYRADGGMARWDADRFGERWEVGAQLAPHWWAIARALMD